MAKKGDAIYLRGNTYWLDCRIRGVRHVRQLGKGISRTVAGELAQVERGRILSGEAGILTKKRKDPTFEQASKWFLEWAESNTRPNTYHFYVHRLKALRDSFAGERRLSTISPFHVEAHKQKVARAEKKVSANRDVATLKTLYNRMLHLKKYAGVNPAVGIKYFRETKDEEEARFLSYEEEEALVANAAESLGVMIRIGVHAGLRIAAILSLQWKNVTLREWRDGKEHSFIRVLGAHSKTKKFRKVPINSKLLATLEGLRQTSPGTEPEDFLFCNRDGAPSTYSAVRSAFRKARKRAGLGKDVTFHTTRHTFASRLVMAGADLRTVQLLGGWASLKMLERYAHLTPDHKEQAVEKLTGQDSPESSQRVSQQEKHAVS